MINTLKSKRKITFFLTLDSQRKKLFTKHFCYSLIKKKNYPELEKDEVLMEMNHFEPSKIYEVMRGKFYIPNYLKVFGTEAVENSLTSDSLQITLNNSYNPYQTLEKTRNIESMVYERMNAYQYFSIYEKFLKAFDYTKNEMEKNKSESEVQNFIRCLCKIYIGHSIHERINNEISKKTNLYILKGDYFFSLGYYTVSKMGNPLLIKFYSKIAENFAKKVFDLNQYIKSYNTNLYETKYMNLLVKKYVGFIYYGCCGIKELHQNNFLFQHNSELMKELSFKYGLLLYLREELAFLKDKSYEFYSKAEDLFSTFLIFSENILKELYNDQSEVIKQKINYCLHTQKYTDKYKYLALNICSDLLEIIDTLKKNLVENNNEEGLINVEEMKNYLKIICRDVENLTRI